jgi:hypothetical protein
MLTEKLSEPEVRKQYQIRYQRGCTFGELK